MVYSNLAQLQAALNNAANIAVKNTCDKLLEKLKEYIQSEYYDMYDPKKYTRTFQFAKSALSEMLSRSAGKIFMNPDVMNYADWSGVQQIVCANEGLHGGVIETDGAYWDTFVEYCEDNAIDILKNELRSQGLNIK